MDLPPGLVSLARELRSLPDDKARALKLVELGDAYVAAAGGLGGEEERGGMRRVPGCVSVVHMGVALEDEGRGKVSSAWMFCLIVVVDRPRSTPPQFQPNPTPSSNPRTHHNTTPTPTKNQAHDRPRRLLRVRGTSDARVSQGMVAVVARGLTGADAAAALALEPEGLATVRLRGFCLGLM